MDISFMTVLKLFYLICSPFLIFAAAHDLGYCADPHCSVPVAVGLTLQSYNADESGKLSFQPNQKVQVFVKYYGEKKNLVGVLLNGKRGFISQTFVHETAVKIRNLVPAEINFSHIKEDQNNVATQASQLPNQDVHNHNLDAAIIAQSTIQDQQTYPENSFKPTENSMLDENPHIDMSPQAQPPSSEGYLDSQSGGHTHQTSPHVTHPPQQSPDTLVHTNVQQQVSDLGTSHSSPSQYTDVNTYQHNDISGVANTAQQHTHATDTAQQPTHAIDIAQQHTHATDTAQQHTHGTDTAQQHTHATDTAQQHTHATDTAQQHTHATDTAQQHTHATDTAQQPIHETNTAQQHLTSDVSNTPQQQYAPDLNTIAQLYAKSLSPSQNGFISNTQNHIHDSMNTEQMSPHFSSPEPQYGEFSSGNSPYQQKIDSIQASFTSQSLGYPSASSFPSSFSGTTNGPGGEVYDYLSNHPQTDPALPNVASDVKQRTDPFINQHNLDYPSKESPPFNPPNKQGIQNVDDQYQDTMKLLANIGIDTNEYNHGYPSDTSSDHPNLFPSSDTFQQSKVNPSSEYRIQESHVISQTASLESSFQASTTHLKADHLVEKTSHTVEQQKSDISDVSQLDEKHEDDADADDDEEDDEDEAEVEDEVDDMDMNDDINNQNENTVGIDQKSEKEIESAEAVKQVVNPHSFDSVSPSETPSYVHKSSKQFDGDIKVDGASTVSDTLASQKEFGRERASSLPTEFNENDTMVDDFAENNKETTENSRMVELNTQSPADIEVKENFTVQSENITNKELNLAVGNDSLVLQDDILSKEEINVTAYVVGENPVEAEDFSFDSTNDVFNNKSVDETDNFIEKEEEALAKLMNNVELSKDEDHLNPYQIRNLKEDQESKNNGNVESSDEMGENITYLEDDEYSTLENSIEAIRSFIEEFMTWVPEPFYSIIMELQNKGISPRVPVFTAVCAIPCIILFIAFVYIKESSKEKDLTVMLAHVEKDVFTLSAEKIALEEKLEKTSAEFESAKNMLDEERKTFDSKTTEVVSLKQLIEKANLELESNVGEINTLKEREKEYMQLVKDHEKIHLDLMEEKSSVEKKVADQEDEINKLSDQLDEKENEFILLQTEVEKFKQSNDDYEEKLNQLQTNCNQLLKEAEVWNMRVNELNSKLNEESSAKEELKNSLELKDAEVESLTNLVQMSKLFEETDSGNDDEHKSKEEKLKCLMDSSTTLIKLQKQEEESKLLSDKLLAEKDKILEMEVELLDSKSEIDKLKVNYKQAIQDKTEASTKLEVLTNYFKDKELLLQKQLGVQEAFRERREKDADSAERQIVLIEQENASYKYQVASMKQEMEETERNLKTQIATQEKKAHENWIAARAAERKLEDMKQEVTQLRQKLTLLEREQESWVNSSRDDILRPIPKRISGMNDESTNGQENSLDPRHIFHPPPPMMLPPDRPLPPLPPLPPFLPPLEPPPFRPQPWHHMDPNSDFRMTPPDFMRGREAAPRHSAIMDGDMGPLQSSPLGGSETRDSRNSTPPHSLPDFHDIPPPPPPPRMPFFPPPPGHHPRYPMPPPYRREFAPGQKRTDNQSDNSSIGRGTQPSSQENWPPNSRV